MGWRDSSSSEREIYVYLREVESKVGHHKGPPLPPPASLERGFVVSSGVWRSSHRGTPSLPPPPYCAQTARQKLAPTPRLATQTVYRNLGPEPFI